MAGVVLRSGRELRIKRLKFCSAIEALRWERVTSEPTLPAPKLVRALRIRDSRHDLSEIPPPNVRRCDNRRRVIRLPREYHPGAPGPVGSGLLSSLFVVVPLNFGEVQ